MRLSGVLRPCFYWPMLTSLGKQGGIPELRASYGLRSVCGWECVLLGFSDYLFRGLFREFQKWYPVIERLTFNASILSGSSRSEIMQWWEQQKYKVVTFLRI